MSNFHPDPKPNFLLEKMKRKADKQRDKTNADRSHRFFYKSVWQTQAHICFECGEPIPFYDKRFIHHLIEKRKQKDYDINLDNTENGRILCLICHDQARLDLSKLPKTNAATIEIMKKYEPFLKKGR